MKNKVSQSPLCINSSVIYGRLLSLREMKAHIARDTNMETAGDSKVSFVLIALVHLISVLGART